MNWRNNRPGCFPVETLLLAGLCWSVLLLAVVALLYAVGISL